MNVSSSPWATEETFISSTISNITSIMLCLPDYILSGALKFSWEDGWYKCSDGSISVHDTCSSPSDAFPGGESYPEWFGLAPFVNSVAEANFDDPIRVRESYCRFKKAWEAFPRAKTWSK
jgi:hypothetical protein